MDNRHKDSNPVIDEILNDDTPLDDSVPFTVPGNEEPPVETPPVVPPVTPPAADPDDIPVIVEGETPDILVDDKGADNLPDDKTRLKEQRVEATLQNERNNSLLSTIDKAQAVPDPTQEEIEKYAKDNGAESWEDLSVVEQNLMKKAWKSDQVTKALNDGVQDIRNTKAWADKVDTLLTENASSQTHKGLIGREAAFREYAMAESHRGASMDLLIDSFLFKNPATAPARKGALPMATAGGGDNPNPKPDVISDADEAAQLRKNNPREYDRLNKAGKIQISLE